MENFKDNFSKQSDIYARYRPQYPPELFKYLASLTEEHKHAWDCGTGNGQAAIDLSLYYDKVIATDPSEQQIKNSFPNKKVQYLVEKAESTSIPSNSIDLLTIANALHWFDFDLFYKEARRILKNNGVIAAWCYGIPSVSPEINKVLKQFHDDVLGNYWKPENRLVEKEYTTISFPFKLIDSPAFFSERAMNLDEMIEYLNTWSATQRFITENKYNPTEQVKKDLNLVWGNAETKKKLTWKLVLKIGRI